MRERPILFIAEMVRAILDGRKTQTRRVIKAPKGFEVRDAGVEFGCPYGQPGDRLWVRESFAIGPRDKDVIFAADKKWDVDGKPLPPAGSVWKPSIFMPHWASRIILEITGVRVERVQAISEEDAYAEGRSLNDECDPVSRPGGNWFRKLWDSLNAKRGFGWDVNPWAWVIEFKRIEEGRTP